MNRSSSSAVRLGSAAFVLVMATIFFGAGCGAASSPNAGFGDTKAAGAALPPPENLGEAEAQFASAEQNVFRAFGQDKRDIQGPYAQPPGQQTLQHAPAPTTVGPEASPPPPPGDAKPQDKAGEARTAMGGATADAAGLSAGPCETACRALASMDRAASHICMLAGDESDRCTNAKERVRAATERVRQSCSDCGLLTP